MKLRIEFPNFNIKIEIRKNREDLLTNDAIINNGNEILNAPAVMVNILYGIGVNPAVKIIKKPSLVDEAFTQSFLQTLGIKDEMLNIANFEPIIFDYTVEVDSSVKG